ncbi:tRNA lysidine(34) synthetase TilS [Psychroflexus lacisalsi]|jgi:tRNA(Ile)-lysidine synthase|uniref:tRNA(Ile)-lysidine synthase n=1 Tax=Psychroflexus lacisalsi TaxID=503928 RepID=A0ABN1KBM5_9FLAO|nr:tRNA lysidine(34) synthetase TilS [Psychroflexus lacisalsi]MBZ9620562.1 tRNA lysidine(34) synthetase TilS [Psychroflexus lacisalsi]
MQDHFQKHIEEKFPELLQQKFIIAISGGIDSVVLAHLCHSLNLNFSLAHCNFKLREEESDKDAQFIKGLANSLKCQFFIKEFDTKETAKTNKNSIQITARNLRYNWFYELVKSTNHHYLVTAHHLNDSLETFIINLSRSTGIKGLSGIPGKNDFIRRPLLTFTRNEIESFALEKKIEWTEDQSNKSTKYLRNKIRHQVVPTLMDLTPNFLKNFKSSLIKIQEAELLIEDYTHLLFKEIVNKKQNSYEISIEKLNSFSNQKAVLYQLLEGFGFTEWDDVYHLKDAQTGKKVYSSTHQLIKDRENLILKTLESSAFETLKIKKDEKNIDVENLKLKVEEVSQLGKFDSQIAYVDKSKLKFPLSLRSIQNGDYFYPFGMEGKKKLSDFLKDERISSHLKSSQLVLCNGNEDIIWVLNLRTDDRYKVNESTEDILKIEIIND